jgi:hypothetical protein
MRPRVRAGVRTEVRAGVRTAVRAGVRTPLSGKQRWTACGAGLRRLGLADIYSPAGRSNRE